MGYTVNLNDFVDQYFEMDPATDDLIFDGTNLRNGMMVLIEDDNYRRAISEIGSLRDADRALVLRHQRWARVSAVTIDMQTTRFLATYADGSKRKITVSTNVGWYVKKDSMPIENADQVSIPVVDFNYADTPQNVLTSEATSFSPFERQRLMSATGTAQVPGRPTLGDTGSIPRIPWKAKDQNNIEEPPHFNRTRETWEQRRGEAPVN